MITHPLTVNCESNFKRREHVCFGISPFNSYFSEDRIRALALWGKREFKSMHFFIPDIPAAYTLEAQGYAKDKAEWKARRQAQYLKNKICRALSSVGIVGMEISEMILDWERLTANPWYKDRLALTYKVFEEDLEFRKACIEASRWVMENKVPDTSTLSEDSLLLAVRYFLTEIPLFIDTAAIVEKSSSVFCYHQRVNFLEKFYAGDLIHKPANHQGFIVIQNSSLDSQMQTPVLEGNENQY